MSCNLVNVRYDLVSGMTPFDEDTCAHKESESKAARIFMWSGTYIDTEGADAVILCRATGTPTPRVTWFNGDDQPIISGSNYQVLHNFYQSMEVA